MERHWHEANTFIFMLLTTLYDYNYKHSSEFLLCDNITERMRIFKSTNSTETDVANNCKSIKWLCRLVAFMHAKISQDTRMHSMMECVAHRFRPIVNWMHWCVCGVFFLISSPFSSSFHFIDHSYQIQISFVCVT